MLIAHISDVHLGKKSPGDPEGAGRLNSFRGALATLAGSYPDVLLVAGDTFDSPKTDVAVVEEAAQSLAGLRDPSGKPVPSVVIPGNHDPADADKLWTTFRTTLGAASAVTLATTPALIDVADGLIVEAYPCLTRFSSEPPWEHRLPARALGSTAMRVVVAHGTLQGGPVPEGEGDAYPFTELQLNALGADYVALGHFHGLYPPWGAGDECQRAFGYCGTHEPDQFTGDAGYAILANVVAGQPTSLRRVRTGKRRWEQVALRGPADLDALERLLTQMKGSDPSQYVIRLNVRGSEWADGGERLDRLEKSMRALGAQVERRGGIRAAASLADIDLATIASGAVKEALVSLKGELEQTPGEGRRDLLAAALRLGWEKVHDSE